MTPDRSTHLKGLAYSAAGMVVISPDGLFIRLIRDAGHLEIIVWRALFIGISLLAVLAVMHRGRIGRAFAGIGRWGWLAVGLLSGTQIGFVGAMTHTSVANTLVILATMPLFAALIGRIFLKERVAPRTVAAIALAGIGIAVIFAGSLGGGTLAGDLMALATAALHGTHLVVLRKAGHRIILPALCLSGFVAAAVVLPFADPLSVPTPDLGIIAFQGLIQMPVALVLFFTGTRYTPAAEIALMSLLETILGPIWAWIGVGEVPPAASLAGGAIVVAAIAMNALAALLSPRSRAGRTPEPIPPPPG
jgi:drug/metabolite transporter (DMT)-like permease